MAVEPAAILAGRRVLLPRRADGRLAAAVRAAGAQVDEADLISRIPVAGPEVEQLAADLAAGQFDWLELTSAFTVEALGRLEHPLPDLVAPGLRVAVVGAATAAAVQAAGVRVDLRPAGGSGGVALAEAWPAGRGRVAIPGALDSSPELGEALRRRGWEVVPVGVYRTSPATGVPETVRTTWSAGGYDALVATAGSVARSAAALLGTRATVVAVGEATARACRRAGFTRVVTADGPGGAEVVAALALACQGEPG